MQAFRDMIRRMKQKPAEKAQPAHTQKRNAEEVIRRIQAEQKAKQETLQNDPEAYRLEQQRKDAEYQAQQAFQRGGMDRDWAYHMYGLNPDGSWIEQKKKG